MEYNGRPLTMGPVNITLAQVAALLDARRPVRVVLEPGDATRYEFLLVPLVGQLAGTGGYDDGALAHIPVNHWNDSSLMALQPQFSAGPFDFQAYANGHTRLVMAEFHNLLREARSPEGASAK